MLQAHPAAPGLELTEFDGSLKDDQGYSLTSVEVRPGLLLRPSTEVPALCESSWDA